MARVLVLTWSKFYPDFTYLRPVNYTYPLSDMCSCKMFDKTTLFQSIRNRYNHVLDVVLLKIYRNGWIN
jgi:hypothetical protein